MESEQEAAEEEKLKSDLLEIDVEFLERQVDLCQSAKQVHPNSRGTDVALESLSEGGERRKREIRSTSGSSPPRQAKHRQTWLEKVPEVKKRK
eukprot:756534-Hanusia_phi.AAC.2